MDYEEVIELEANIKLKNRAEEIYKDFKDNIKLDVSTYKGKGRFLFWSDGNNEKYFTIQEDCIYFDCNFLHERYGVEVTVSAIFYALKNKSRVIDHLESTVTKAIN